MAKELTVQLFADGKWHDAYRLKFFDPLHPAEGVCVTGYNSAFYVENIEVEDELFEHSVSVQHRLNLNSLHIQGLPAFLLDIIPAGAAFRSLKKRFGSQKPDDVAMDLFLLERCTPAPIGHLRIKESLPFLAEGTPMGFSRREVAERNTDFLEYAYEQGAAIGGATGAGGEAPKLLLAENHQGQLFAEATLSDEHTHKHWFVKFPRNRASSIDQDILRAEYHYYRAVNAVGLHTIAPDGLTLMDEAEHRPSLWMPRFDRAVTSQGVLRLPVESIYSVCGVAEYGAFLSHEQVLARLVELWTASGQEHELFELATEYVARDLLNRILGNSDNHGRNMSIIRAQGRLTLAPIYDLAPMVLDPDGISRVTKWQDEKAGNPNWRSVCQNIAGDDLFDALRARAEQLRALPDLLTQLPASVRNAPAFPLTNSTPG